MTSSNHRPALQNQMLDELLGHSKGITVDQIMVAVGFSSRRSTYKAISRMRDEGFMIDGNKINGRVRYRLLAA